MLVHRLLREILPDIHLKVIRINRGFWRRKITTAESNQQHLREGIFNDIAAIIVWKCPAPLGTDGEFTEIISVRSFEKENAHYIISLDVSGSMCQRSCPYMTDTKSICKHMFLAERHLSYVINYGAENRSSSGLFLIESERVTDKFRESFAQENYNEVQTECLNQAVFEKINKIF